MKKFIINCLVISLISTPLYADKLLKSGFLSGEWDLNTNFVVKNPEEKIVLIYNHGSEENDKPSKNCQWKNNVRNFASLSGKKINNKSCNRIGINNGERWTEPLKNGHWMSFGDCFQFYNPKILEFIESKI